MFLWELDDQERKEKKEDEEKNLKKVFNYNYKLPLSMFIVFEKCNIFVMSSQRMYRNHYLVFLPKKFYYGFFSFIKNDVFLTNSTFIDQSVIDLNSLDNSVNLELDYLYNFYSKNKILFNVFYFYFIKIRITFFSFLNNSTLVESTDTIYSNSAWLERETSEMFGVFFKFKKDSRCLLLDYSKNENPMLKSFPCEGYYDIYYNFFDHKLKYISNDLIEL